MFLKPCVAACHSGPGFEGAVSALRSCMLPLESLSSLTSLPLTLISTYGDTPANLTISLHFGRRTWTYRSSKTHLLQHHAHSRKQLEADFHAQARWLHGQAAKSLPRRQNRLATASTKLADTSPPFLSVLLLPPSSFSLAQLTHFKFSCGTSHQVITTCTLYRICELRDTCLSIVYWIATTTINLSFIIGLEVQNTDFRIQGPGLH